MWTRARIKQEAKDTLRRFGYWLPLLITLVYSFFSGSLNYSGNLANSSSVTYTFEYQQELSPAGFAMYFEEFFGNFGSMIEDFFTNPLIAMTTAFFIALGFVLGFVISIAWSSLVVSPIMVGKNRFFMEHRAFGSKFDRLFWSFKSGRYKNIAKTMFIYEVKIFLWSLLFVVPGIIKSYEYFMVPYILAENPDISTERAFDLSKAMTKGEKWKIFILQLSFIGWMLLGVLCCCVGTAFVMPYYEATFAELYQVMREKALGLGFSNYSELIGFYPENN